jgi:hypothetical protein
MVKIVLALEDITGQYSNSSYGITNFAIPTG